MGGGESGRHFLVDEVFAGKFTFRHAGLSPVEVEAEQLRGAAGTVPMSFR